MPPLFRQMALAETARPIEVLRNGIVKIAVDPFISAGGGLALMRRWQRLYYETGTHWLAISAA